MFSKYGQAVGPLESIHLLKASFAGAVLERMTRAVFSPAVAIFLTALGQPWVCYAASLICSLFYSQTPGFPSVHSALCLGAKLVWNKTGPLEGNGSPEQVELRVISRSRAGDQRGKGAEN